MQQCSRWRSLPVCLAEVLAAALLVSGCTTETMVCRNPNALTEQAKGCTFYEKPDVAQTIYFIYFCVVKRGCPKPEAKRTTLTLAQTQTCPAINFSQASIQMMSYSDTTTNLNYVVPMYRQPDGSFTAEAFSQPTNPDGTVNTNVPGTNAGNLTQAQTYLATCQGISQWTPKPHPTILADLPGTMARRYIVTNLGGAAYAEIQGNQVSLDSQTTLGNMTTGVDTGAPLLTADFNGDGKRDLAGLNSGSPGSVYILLGNGNGTLGTAKSYNVGNYPVAMTSLDFNHDGRPDLAVINQVDSTVTVLLDNPDGSMRTAGTYTVPGNYGEGQNATAIVAADFDGDGNPDLMVYTEYIGFTLLHGKGDGTFQVLPQKTGYTPHYNPVFLAPGDFNKDGKMDLAAFNDDGTVAILLNAGDGSFPTQNRYVVGTPLSSGVYSPAMFATDFNDDGNLDLVFGNGHPDALYPGPQSITVLFGNGDGTFQGAAPAIDAGYPLAMASADFNGDGRRDLVVAGGTDVLGGGLYILLGQSGGGFQTPTRVAMPSGAGFAAWVATADLNGDGKPDLIAIDNVNIYPPVASHVYTWLGNGDGTFQAPTSYSAGMNPTFVTAGDVNGDGLADLVIAYGNQSATTAGTTSVVLMTGKAGGGFNPATMVPTGVNTVQVTLADVNGDGKLDLIATNLGMADVYGTAPPTPGNVTVALGNGTGTFQTATPYTVSVNPTWVAVGDVNGDGKPDLGVGTASDTEADIGVLLGNGAGTFQTPKLFQVYSWPSRLVLADFDGDGKLDLAVVHQANDPPLTLWQGNGDGTFQEQQLLFAGDSPGAAIAGDFGAGRIDLAVMNQPQSEVTVNGTVNLYRNLAPGSVVVPPAATHFTASAPASATAGVSFNYTVTALDANNNTVTGYTGTVHFSSTDAAAVLPTNATLTNGTGMFAATLKTSGSQTITATDTATASITGTSAAITVTTTGTVASMPASVSPAGGGASNATYTFTYTDPRGYQDLNVVNVLVNNFLDGRHACYLAYVVSSSTLILVDDGGDAGGPYAGSVALGNSAAIQNSQCAVTLVSAVGSGNTLTLTLTITWTASFAGDKIIQLAARDTAQNNSGWYPLGVARAPGPVQTPIAVVGMSPNRAGGSGPTQFTFNWSDTKGFADMGVENILINTALNGHQACYLAFSRPGNVLYLVNDGGTALLPAQSLAAGGSLSNSQCTVTWGATAVSASGNNLSLTLNIAFMGALAGNDVIYLASRDVNEANSTDWHAMGTWSPSATGTGGGTGGTLTGTFDNSAALHNLTAEGGVDWVHWGGGGDGGTGTLGVTRKANGSQIGTLTPIGNFSSTGYGNDLRPLAWTETDGTPQVAGANSNDTWGLHWYGVGNGYSLTVPASNTAANTLTLHVSGVNCSGKLTAHLSDGAMDFPDTFAFGGTLGDRNYTLVYQAGSAGQTLLVMWTMTADPTGGNGTLAISAAALSGGGTSGGGTPAVSLNQTSLPFGTVTVGQTPIPTQMVTIRNAGSAPLTLSSISAPAPYSVVSPVVTPGSPLTVPAGGTLVTVQFNPTAVGTYSGSSYNLTIASNDPGSPKTIPLSGTATASTANVILSDSFQRADAPACSLGQADLARGGSGTYFYLPIAPGASGPAGANLVSDALQNNGTALGGVQLTASSGACANSSIRGVTLPQDLDIQVDLLVPFTGVNDTDAGPYFRSRAAAAGDGIIGGSSAGYWVELVSTGEVRVKGLNPFALIVTTGAQAGFDAAVMHTLRMAVQGSNLQVSLDGQLQAFTQNGAQVTTVTLPATNGTNNGAVGISFGNEDNSNLSGGQRATNLVISAYSALGQ